MADTPEERVQRRLTRVLLQPRGSLRGGPEPPPYLALVQAQPSAPLWAPWLEGRSHWGYTLVRGRPVSPEGEDKGRFASGALRPTLLQAAQRRLAIGMLVAVDAHVLARVGELVVGVVRTQHGR